jgi:hypothetical protein
VLTAKRDVETICETERMFTASRRYQYHIPGSARTRTGMRFRGGFSRSCST